MRISKIQIVLLASSLMFSSQVIAALKVGENEVLAFEDFSEPIERDSQMDKGWNYNDKDESEPCLTLMPTEKGMKFTLNKSYAGLTRRVKVDLGRVREEGVYLMANVVEVGGLRGQWGLGDMTSVGVFKSHPGVWTFPKKNSLKFQNPVLVSFHFYEYQPENPDYIILSSIQLVSGLAPGGVIWRRENEKNWEVPLQKGEKITLLARLGPLKEPPAARLVHCEGWTFKGINMSEEPSLEMNDSGKDGDEVAGDGIWTAQFKYKPISVKMNCHPLAEITADKEGYGYYGFSPWGQGELAKD